MKLCVALRLGQLLILPHIQLNIFILNRRKYNYSRHSQHCYPNSSWSRTLSIKALRFINSVIINIPENIDGAISLSLVLLPRSYTWFRQCQIGLTALCLHSYLSDVGNHLALSLGDCLGSDALDAVEHHDLLWHVIFPLLHSFRGDRLLL